VKRLVGLKSYPRAYFELLLSALTLIMGMSLPSAFLPIFARELDPSELLVGLVSSAWFISRIFTELPSGILADRLGRRRLLVGGLALSAVGAFTCSSASLIHLLILGRALWGLGTGLFFISSSATIFDLFKSKVRGQALGTFQAIQFMGSLIGAPIGSFMVEATGYNGVFLVASMLMVCSFLVAFLSKSLKQTEIKTAGQDVSLSLREVLPSIKNWGLTSLYINSLTRMLIWVGIAGTVFPLFLNLELGVGVEYIGLVISSRTVGIILATAISGYMSDKTGRKPMIVLGMITEACSLYAYTLAASFEAFLLIGLMEGFGRGMVLTSMMVMLSEVAPPKFRGGAIGMYRTFMDVGGFIGPLLFMEIFGKLGSHSAFFSAIGVTAASVALILTIKAPEQMKEED
jgi:MFS family permease